MNLIRLVLALPAAAGELIPAGEYVPRQDREAAARPLAGR
jgi:hypothetical protein